MGDDQRLSFTDVVLESLARSKASQMLGYDGLNGSLGAALQKKGAHHSTSCSNDTTEVMQELIVPAAMKIRLTTSETWPL